MRAVVFGVGGIGGTVAAALSLNGIEVIGIARGAQLNAIRARGLRVRTPRMDKVVRFDCVGSVAEAGLRPDDIVLLCMKTQDTAAALEDLRAAGLRDQPIFCLQNGVANERMALRLFPNVHGVTVMVPASFLTPGEIAVHAEPKLGIFDIGRYPHGQDADDTRLAQALDGSLIAGFVLDDVMASKYGKLLMNLGNILEAALGKGHGQDDLVEAARDEARAVYAAHGIAFADVSMKDPRRAEHLRITDIEGVERVGGSTTQSLLRGLGSVETDYLNGEIVLLGRLAGVPTPVNAGLVALAARLVQEGAPAGGVDAAQLRADLALA